NFLHIHPQTLREKAIKGEVPGCKIGKRWVFVEEDLVTCIRSHYPKGGHVVRVTNQSKEDNSCHYTAGQLMESGGLTFHYQRVSEYENLLARKKKPKQKSMSLN